MGIDETPSFSSPKVITLTSNPNPYLDSTPFGNDGEKSMKK
jgi:hypothetical protein